MDRSALTMVLSGKLQLVVALLFTAAPVAAQAVVAGVSIPEVLRAGDRILTLASCGVRDTLWIDHYVAALYLAAGASLGAVQDPAQPKAVRIEIITARYMSDDVPEQWRAPLAQELSREPMSRLRNAYRNLAAGDVVVLAYDPGVDVSMRVNGRTVVRTPGHDAIDAILGAWAEEDPISMKLQRLKLENPCPAR